MTLYSSWTFWFVLRFILAPTMSLLFTKFVLGLLGTIGALNAPDELPVSRPYPHWWSHVSMP